MHSTRAQPTHEDIPQDEALKSHRLVLYSSSDPRRKANAALLMALYVVRTTIVLP